MEEQVVVIITSTSPGTWVAPSDLKEGIYNVVVECWGGGGAGGYVLANNSVSSGGAGGAYVRVGITITRGTACNYQVGGGAFGGSYRVDLTGEPGGDTWFKDASEIMAEGGRGAPVMAVNNISGSTSLVLGSTSRCKTIGNVQAKYKGGDGGRSNMPWESGGGGSGAGSTGNGNSAYGRTGGSAKTEYGGAGGNGTLTVASNGATGSNYGSGGSGASTYNGTGPRPSGSGRQGIIRLTYTRILPTTKPFIMKTLP